MVIDLVINKRTSVPLGQRPQEVVDWGVVIAVGAIPRSQAAAGIDVTEEVAGIVIKSAIYIRVDIEVRNNRVGRTAYTQSRTREGTR